MIDRKVMVVEDDDELRGVLVRALGEEGYEIAAVATGADLLERFEAEAPSLLVVDVGLPDADGRDLCQALRARGATLPVIFLSARDAVTDRVTGFTAGGDDYLTKPFALAELLVRIAALLRRAGGSRALEASGLTIDPVTHTARVDGQRIALTPTEFRLLAKLVANRGATVRRRDLVATAWPHGAQVRENTLDQYLARLRRKLRPYDLPPITTVQGVGYLLE